MNAAHNNNNNSISDSYIGYTMVTYFSYRYTINYDLVLMDIFTLSYIV